MIGLLSPLRPIEKKFLKPAAWNWVLGVKKKVITKIYKIMETTRETRR